MENIVATASRLAAILIEGDSPAAVETRRVKELLQTASIQQEAYSYSRDRVHSTPRPSRSYNRRMDEPAVSSNARNRDPPRGHNPAGGAGDAQEVVDQARARREAELAAQHEPVNLLRFVQPHRWNQELPLVLWECRVSSRRYAMCACPRISRAHARC